MSNNRYPVVFWAGTQAEYNALTTKSNNTIYFLLDINAMYRGSQRFGGDVTVAEARQIASAVVNSGGFIASGAQINTSVGGYLLTFTSGGMAVSGGGAAVTLSGGAIFASADNGDDGANVGTVLSMTSNGGVVVSAYDYENPDVPNCYVEFSTAGIVVSGANGERVVMSGGTVDARVDDGEDHQGRVNITNGGVSINASDVTNDTDVLVVPGQVAVSGGNDVDFTVNGRPVFLVPAIDSETTCASIGALAGGTAYIYTQPLTSLTVASVASSMQEAWLEFTVASGGSVSINASGYKYLGGRPSAFEGGSSYAVGFRWGRQAVCVPLEG